MSSSTDATSVKKRKTEDDVQTPVDHRKRRRNRTTQSCLNCHGSKRMVRTSGPQNKYKLNLLQCDRKRPACSRCVKLGLSGICVYEVDDVSQRDTGKDETTHLKNRIAELEGFIREYKRKPHPRWAADMKRTPCFSASPPPRSDIESDAESSSGAKDAPSFDSNDALDATSPTSEFVPATPPTHNNEPIFLTGQDSASFLFSGPTGISPLPSDSPFDIDSTGGGTARESIDDMLGFDTGLSGDDNEMLERVFSQILHQDACRSADAEHDCQCMKKSSAYSVVLALAPHVRRALDALNALPEHRAPRLVESCNYLKHLRELDLAISAVVESVSTSLSSPSSAYAIPSLKPPNGIPPTPTLSADDSPLQRVLAARRAAMVRSSFPSLPPHAPIASEAAQKQVRGEDSLLWGLRDRSSSMSLENPEPDQFMSWDPSARLTWPRTISL
ncbi:hypothetical protein M0805_005349 [Coniferiporia weirii]|nr:hypothetical protein M0805_005349 [Coniferiporia weirii]